ncbi:MAG: hypothetical protein JO247_21450 [Chloroflexi bacterium]|nr:hypothetical protein [Chloroflexota bacterium]
MLPVEAVVPELLEDVPVVELLLTPVALDAGDTLPAAPVLARGLLVLLTPVLVVVTGLAPKVTDPTANWTLSGGAGTLGVVPVVVEAPMLAAGAALLVVDVLDVPLTLEVVEVPVVPVVAPEVPFVQAGLALADVPVVEDAELSGDAELAGLAENELVAPLAPLGEAAVLALTEDETLLTGLAPALPPMLGDAAPPAQPASTNAAARVGMRAFNMTMDSSTSPAMAADRLEIWAINASHKAGQFHPPGLRRLGIVPADA